MALLTQLMTSVADAGLELLRPSERKARRDSLAAVQELCRDLMSSRGEALGTALARDAVEGYRRLDAKGKTAFLKLLSQMPLILSLTHESSACVLLLLIGRCSKGHRTH